MMKAGKAIAVFEEIKTKLTTLDQVTENNGLVKCVRYMKKNKIYDLLGTQKKKNCQ